MTPDPIAFDVAGWIINAARLHLYRPAAIDRLILSPRLTRHGRGLFDEVRKAAPNARPVERPMFFPYDVAVLADPERHTKPTAVLLMWWPSTLSVPQPSLGTEATGKPETRALTFGQWDYLTTQTTTWGRADYIRALEVDRAVRELNEQIGRRRLNEWVGA
jgi:hypothetical protein